MYMYGNKSKVEAWRMGDQKFVYSHKEPCALRATAWESELTDPQCWQFAKDYLDFLGEDRFSRLGYSFALSRETIDKMKPSIRQRFLIPSLMSCLKGKVDADFIQYEY